MRRSIPELTPGWTNQWGQANPGGDHERVLKRNRTDSLGRGGNPAALRVVSPNIPVGREFKKEGQ